FPIMVIRSIYRCFCTLKSVGSYQVFGKQPILTITCRSNNPCPSAGSSMRIDGRRKRQRAISVQTPVPDSALDPGPTRSPGWEHMKVFVGFDDTDVIDSSYGTGKLVRWFQAQLPDDCHC